MLWKSLYWIGGIEPDCTVSIARPLAPSTPIVVVVNRAPSARYRRGEIHAEIIDSAPVLGVVFASDDARVLDEAKGEPVYLIMTMTPERTLRMKPQNLVTGLPIAQLEAVS